MADRPPGSPIVLSYLEMTAGYVVVMCFFMVVVAEYAASIYDWDIMEGRGINMLIGVIINEMRNITVGRGGNGGK